MSSCGKAPLPAPPDYPSFSLVLEHCSSAPPASGLAFRVYAGGPGLRQSSAHKTRGRPLRPATKRKRPSGNASPRAPGGPEGSALRCLCFGRPSWSARVSVWGELGLWGGNCFVFFFSSRGLRALQLNWPPDLPRPSKTCRLADTHQQPTGKAHEQFQSNGQKTNSTPSFWLLAGELAAPEECLWRLQMPATVPFTL